MAYKRKLNSFQKFLPLIIIGIIVINFTFHVYPLWGKYFTSNYWQNFPGLEKAFLNSQYVNKNAKFWIPDEIAFSYAAGKLIKGTNPVLVVPDAPPLGKYLIGLSTLIFNNDSTIILICAVLSLLILFFLSKQVFKNTTLALLPPLLYSFEPIFNNQLKYTPLMDIIQLVFFLGTFILFNKGLKSKKPFVFFVLTNIVFGLSIAIKFFITGTLVIASLYIVLLFHKDLRRFILLTLTVPLSVLILLASYIRVFAFGYTFMKFLGIQKWVLLYHKSQLILPLSVWPLLMINRWYVWFGNKPYISDPQWSITWPIITVISIVTILFYILKKLPRNMNIEVLMAWFAVYIIFLSTGQVFSRYFVIMIPVLYIISIFGIVSVYKKFKI